MPMILLTLMQGSRKRIGQTMSKRNKRLKEEVYSYLSDDEFYERFKEYRYKAKNKFVIQRLREIEQKRWIEANPELAKKLALGCLIVVIIIVVFLSIK